MTKSERVKGIISAGGIGSWFQSILRSGGSRDVGILIATALILVAGWLVGGWRASLKDSSMRKDLLEQVQSVAEALEVQDVGALAGTDEDLDSHAYGRIKEQLGAIRHLYPQCRFLYLLGRKADGTVFFFVDSEPADSDECSPPGQVYEEASETCRNVFVTRHGTVEGPYPDRWGLWVSALIPLGGCRSGTAQSDSEGRTEEATVVLGMDVDASVWGHETMMAAWPPVILAVALAIIISVVTRQRKLLKGLVLKQAVASRQNENRLSDLLSSLPIGVAIIDAETHIIERVNDHVSLLFGAPVEYLVGKRCHKLLCPANEGVCPVCDLGRAVDNSEREMLRSDGTRLPILKTVKRIRLGDREKLLECFVDISDSKQMEQFLQEQRNVMANIIEGTNVGTWRWNIQTGETHFNERWAAIAGYTLDELSPVSIQTWYDMVHPDDQKMSQALLERHFAGEMEYYDCECRMRHKDGSWVWVHDRGKVVERTPDGRVLIMTGTHSDITDRKRAEEALRESEYNFRNLFESMTDIITVVTRDGKMIFANAAATRKLGYSVAEFASMHILDMHPADRRQEAKDIFGGILHGERSDCPLPLARKDGSLMPVHTTVWFGRWNGTDCIIGISKDLTAEIEAQQRFERLFRNNPTLMALSSLPERRFVDVNNAFLNTLGYSRSEVIGKTIGELDLFVHPEQQNEARGKLLADGSISSLELQVRRKDGQIVEGLFSGEIITTQGNQYLLTVMVDITIRKRMEGQLQATNRDLEMTTAKANELASQAKMASIAKSEFLANMSHEIRTPMNGVIGMTGLLLDTNLSDEQRRFAEIVCSSGESLLALINDILDFSKIEANKLNLEVLDFDIRDLMEDFAAMMAISSHSKGLEFLCAVEPGVPSYLRGDAGRLRQILTNLAGNAIKFTERGEISVRASLVSENGSDAKLRFSVRDTGIGIADDKVGTIFESFSQEDSSISRKYGGTGLGLAISKSLTELMGGEIGVTSQKDMGSEFWFTVCLSRQSEQSRPGAMAATIKGVRILVVDDNATNREILRARLSSWGAVVTEAADGPAAIQELINARQTGKPFRFVITDMRMPEMDGQMLGLAIKSDQRISDAQLILMTSLGHSIDETASNENIFIARMTKPVRPLELFTVLSKALAPASAADTPVKGTSAAMLPVNAAARILLAEDNIINQQVAIGMLKKMGLRVDAVANGLEAVKALQNLPYDLVLMDVQMPEMNGLEATSQIRDPRFGVCNSNIPIIAMTANAMPGDREKCLEAGMNDYIAKPISMQVLAEKMTQWLPAQQGAERKETTVDVSSEKAQTCLLPVFDRIGFLDRMMGDEQMALTIIDVFLDDMPRQIGLLRQSIEASDSETIALVAHSIKGAAANVGGEALREAAYEMEKSGKAGNIEAARIQLSKLAGRFEEMSAAIEGSMNRTRTLATERK